MQSIHQKRMRTKMPSIQVGDRAPDFSLPSQAGEMIRLSDYLGKQVVVLFFYPKDGTAICTKEACAFRDAYEQFVDAGAVVIGVSSDSVKKHRAFADAHRLPFLLAADEKGNLRKLFGVPKTLGFLPGRVTYVIDRAGIVQLAFNSQLTADQHVAEALAVVKRLSA
jgi:peroxiredoxin Q/BCP